MNTPLYLTEPYNTLMDKIRNGKLSDDVKYSSVDKDTFIENCIGADPNDDMVQLKYDGWWCAITPEGLFTKDGLLRNKEMHSSNEDIFIGEYIFGTQWATENANKNKVAVYSSNNELAEGLPEFCFEIENYDPNLLVDNLDELYSELDKLISEYEGLVLKNLFTGNFLRFKKTVTGDYVIMDCIKSEAKTLTGWGCGSVAIGLFIDGKLIKMGTAGGFNDKMKKEMFDNPQKFIGKVAQFSGKAIFKSGCLRHPSFDRIREDKFPDMCTMKQFDGLI